MAEVFFGKWQVDLSSNTGMAEFGASAGFSAERIETYSKLSYSLEFSPSGDGFSAKVVFDKEGVPPQEYTFKLGEEFDYKSIDGTQPKLTITIEDGKMKEEYKLGDKAWSTVREISGGVMTANTCVPGGPSVVQKLNKA